MTSKARSAGHPAHPILIVFPLGQRLTSVFFDVIYFINEEPSVALIGATDSRMVFAKCRAVPGQ